MKIKIKMLKDEHWWGGSVTRAEEMPFDENSKIVIDLVKRRGTLQSAPLFYWKRKLTPLLFKELILMLPCLQHKHL